MATFSSMLPQQLGQSRYAIRKAAEAPAPAGCATSPKGSGRGLQPDRAPGYGPLTGEDAFLIG